MKAPTTNTVKAMLAGSLVAISAATLFVPLAEGAGDVKAMFILLTGIAVRDYFGSVSADKRVEDVKQAYDPKPPTSYIEGHGEE